MDLSSKPVDTFLEDELAEDASELVKRDPALVEALEQLLHLPPLRMILARCDRLRRPYGLLDRAGLATNASSASLAATRRPAD